MTKAERIFKATYAESFHEVKVWGERRNPNGKIIPWNGLIAKEADHVCTRTLNDIEKEIAKKERNLDILEKFESPETETDKALYRNRRLALEMVKATVEIVRGTY